MSDEGPLRSTINAVQQGYELAKGLWDSAEELKQTKANRALNDVMKALLDAEKGLIDAQQEINRLSGEIDRMTAAKQITVRETNQMYVQVDDKGNDIDGVFCSRCYDQDLRIVRISRPTAHNRGVCPQCDASYDLFSATYYDLKSSIKKRQSTGS